MTPHVKRRLKRYGRRAYFLGLYVAAAVVVWHATVGARRQGSRQADRATTAHELMCDLGRGPEKSAPLREKSALLSLPYLSEASGLALSRRTPGMLWSLDDSGEPAVIAVDADGKARARVRVEGAGVDDWEDVSVGPCANGSCLYIADIGDNSKNRKQVTVYRMPEPAATADAAVHADALLFDYPGQSHDAEGMFVGPDRTLYLVTKGHPTTLYRATTEARPGAAAQLTRVAELPLEQYFVDNDRKETRITDAEATPDGKWVALRTNSELLLFRTRDLVAGTTTDAWHADLRPLGETQGEGVAISNGGDIYLSGEGGRRGAPGSLAHIKCVLPD